MKFYCLLHIVKYVILLFLDLLPSSDQSNVASVAAGAAVSGEKNHSRATNRFENMGCEGSWKPEVNINYLTIRDYLFGRVYAFFGIRNAELILDLCSVILSP